MKQSLHALSLITIFMFFGDLKITAQDSTIINDKISSCPDKIFKRINAKTEATNKKLLSQSNKYLNRMAREEQKLRRKLSRIDSAAAERIFGDAANQYSLLQQKIKNASGIVSNLPKKYLPHLDSLQTALQFLDKTKGLLQNNPQTDMLLKKALGNMDLLQEKFSQVDNIKQYMKQRRTFLKDQLGAYGLTKDLKKLQKQVYYYQVQVEEYKQAFNNPSLIEARVLAMLRKTTLFKNFFREHSQLAGLFRLPETSQGNPIAGFIGLQTRESVEQQLLQRFGSLPDVQQMAMHQINEGQSQLNQLKSKAGKLSSANADAEMPDFKPNNQKTKSFIKRLEVGTNLQTVKSNNFFPSTSDVALSLGYKLNDKSTIGIGSSYKMGWGKDIRHISISHQGIGLRSFLDVKIKGSFWLSGGAEMNYRSQFSNFEILNDYTPWQKSALLGLSKKYRVSNKLKGNMQLMYDFIYKQQVPRTQPLVFRIGYIL
jgi:hypothetical protein